MLEKKVSTRHKSKPCGFRLIAKNAGPFLKNTNNIELIFSGAVILLCRESYCDPVLGTKLHLSKVSKQFVDELLGKNSSSYTSSNESVP